MAVASYTKMLAVAVTWTAVVFAQTSGEKLPRTVEGKPDLNGIWQALNTADWDLQAHGSEPGPVSSLAQLAVSLRARVLSRVAPSHIFRRLLHSRKRTTNIAGLTILRSSVSCRECRALRTFLTLFRLSRVQTQF